MTKRLAISMLLTVWAILIAAGVTAYWTTRSVIVSNMDESLVARATPIAEQGRYLVKNGPGQTVQRGADAAPTRKAQLLRAAFVRLGDGQRVRTVSVRTWTPKPDGSQDERTVTLSEPADKFDHLMNQLIISLLLVGCG